MLVSKQTKHILATLGHLVRVVRKQQKVTQQEFAERLGVSRQTLINLEKGHTCVSLSTMIEACVLLDIPVLALKRIDNTLVWLESIFPSRVDSKQQEIDDDF